MPRWRHRFKLRLSNKDIALWIISQRALPPVSIVIPLYVMFLDLGILATPIPLILTYAVVNLPIVVWLSRDFVARVPYEIEESAIVDGASRYRIFLVDHPSDDQAGTGGHIPARSDPELE